jgi:hypothetical protein
MQNYCLDIHRFCYRVDYLSASDNMSNSTYQRVYSYLFEHMIPLLKELSMARSHIKMQGMLYNLIIIDFISKPVKERETSSPLFCGPAVDNTQVDSGKGSREIMIYIVIV